MNILTFLTAWASRVYEWFGDLYERARDVVLNVWNWILVNGNNVLLAAIRWAYDAIQQALGTAWNWIFEQYNELLALLQQARSYLHQRIDDTIRLINDTFSGIYETVSGWFTNVYDYIVMRIDDVFAAVWSWVEEVRGFASALFSGITDYVDGRIGEINAFLTDVRSILFGTNSAGTPVLLSFLLNPFGFILAHVWGVFQDLLCYGLAYGLGTVNADLPDPPEWDGGGISGTVGGHVSER